VIALLIGIVSGLLSSAPMLGPVALLLLAAGASQQRREGRALALGAALSEGVHVALVVAGLAPLLLAEPAIATGLRVVSGVVLLALAVVAWRKRSLTLRPLAPSPRRAFGLGVLLVLPHPGFLVVWLALVTFLAEQGFAPTSPLFVVGAVIGIGLWFMLLLWGAGRVGPTLVARRGALLARVLAIALGAFGMWILVRAVI